MDKARPQDRARPSASRPMSLAAAVAAPNGPNRQVAWKPRSVTCCEMAARPIRVIACDSVIPDESNGELCGARLTWLEAALDATADKPVIIAIHHPPFPCGLPGFGATGLGGADVLAGILAGRTNVLRIIAGHNHRTITGMCGPVPACVAPSVSYPFAFDTTAGAPLAIAYEPPGCAMHLWREDIGLLTHTLPIGDFGPATPLLKDGKRLLPTSTNARE